jgi:RNA polymerase sigma-70 factor (ECF subfamily)
MSLDERVAELLLARDTEAAATEALRELGPTILRYLRSLLRDEADARDAFSQFAENLWKGLPGFRREASLRTWAFRLAWHAALNIRDEAWRRRRERLATSAASRLADEIGTRTMVRVERQRRALEVLRESLSVEDRSLLVLRVDQALPWNEIAEILAAEGKPAEPAALMKRFERLKDRLARMAKDQGLVD